MHSGDEDDNDPWSEDDDSWVEDDSWSEDDDCEPDEVCSYEPPVKGPFMGYEYGSCCGDGALSIPPRFLERHPGRFQSVVFSLNPDGRVLVYPVENWFVLQRRVFNAWGRPGMQRLRLLMRSGVTRLVLHERGYFKIPRSLRKRGNLDRGIVIIGYEDHLEMVSESHWQMARLGDHPNVFADDLSRLDRIEAGARKRKEQPPDRPEEASQVLIVAASEQLLALLKANPDHLKELSPEDLEAFVAERLERMGFAVIRIGPTRRADGGIDFIVCPKDPVPFPYLLAVQVKSHRGRVHTSVREVRDFAGAVMTQPVRGGVLVTNTNFTMDAQWFAGQQRHILSLRGFDDLSRWIHDDFAAREPWRDIPDVLELRPGLMVDMRDELAGKIYHENT